MVTDQIRQHAVNLGVICFTMLLCELLHFGSFTNTQLQGCFFLLLRFQKNILLQQGEQIYQTEDKLTKKKVECLCRNVQMYQRKSPYVYVHAASSSTFHHTCRSISSPRHSWLKFCPSCSSGNLAVCTPLTPAMRAVNCWLLFHSDLESARQQSKAFAFKALKLIWHGQGSLG